MRTGDRLDDSISRLEALRTADLAALQLFREYIDRRFVDLEAQRQAQREGDMASVRVASTNLERRLDTILEFGRQLSDQANGFLSREVYEAGHEALRVNLDVARGSVDTLRTQHVQDVGDLRGQISSMRARTVGYTAGLVAVVSILATVIAVIQIAGK